MAKISALDPVAEPDGTETVVILKGGIAKRTGIGALVSAAVSGLIAAASAALNAVVDAATTAINALVSTASGHADAAATSAAAAADAVAGVPVGSALQLFTGHAPDNRGQTGDRGYSTDLHLTYPARTADGWSAGISPTGELVEKEGVILDMALGTFPAGIATTRAQAMTDLLVTDLRSDYATIGANLPVQHPLLGLLAYPQSEQFVSDPTGPGDGAVALAKAFVAGKVCVKIHGNGTLTSVAGTATGTGFGAITAEDGPQTITLTTGGSIDFTLAGSDAGTEVQVEQSPLFPTASIPTPFMPNVGTRNTDTHVLSGDHLAALQADEGTAIYEVTIPVNKTNNTILGVNTNVALLQATGNTTLQFYDGPNFQAQSIGMGDFRSTVKVGLTWRAGKIAFMGGSRIPFQFATSLLDITSARLGAAITSNVYGQQSLGGGISLIKRLDRATITAAGDDIELFDLVSPLKRPTVADFLNWNISDPLPVARAKVSQLIAGSILSAAIICTGPSHTAGVTGFANSWPAQLARELASAGYPAHDRAFFGGNGTSWGAGTSSHDGRWTYTVAAPALYGKSLGGECLRLAAGSTHTVTWSESATKLRVIYYTDAGRGSFTVSAGAGPIAPDGGGSSVIDTNGALGIAVKTFTKPEGALAWTLTISGNIVDIAGVFDPVGMPVMNVGRGGYTAVDMSNGGLVPQSSYPLALSVIDAALIIVAPDNTNSANGAIAAATYRSAVATQLDYAVGRGCDVMAVSDPMSAPGVIAEPTQQLYAGILTQEVMRRDLPFFPFRRWQERYGYTALHASGFYFENNVATGLHLGTRGNDWLFARPLASAIISALPEI
jgi:hypothetical protein